MVDILMSVLIVGGRIFMIYYINLEPIFYSQSLIAAFSLILAGSAFYISRSVKKSTGKG